MALIACPECGQQISDQAPNCPHCGTPIARTAAAVPPPPATAPAAAPPKKKKTGCFALGCLVLLGLIVVGALMSRSDLSNTPADVHPVSKEEQALNNTKLVDFNWQKGGFDNVMLADFIIRNDNDFDVKDITVECRHYGASGTLIDSNKCTIYDVVKKKGKKTFKGFNMGFIHNQAKSSDCRIVTVVPVQ